MSRARFWPSRCARAVGARRRSHNPKGPIGAALAARAGARTAPLLLPNSVPVKTEEISKTFRIASEAQRHQALGDAVLNSPGIRKVREDAGKRLAEAINLQIKTRDLLSPSLEALMLEQNQRIADMLNTSGMRKAFAGINFNLPEGWAEQVAAYREQIATEIAGEGDTEDVGSGFGRLAEEREAIITCLQRIGFALEGFAYLPRSPIPPFVGYLILLLAVLGQVADEKLSEREDSSA